MSEFKSIDPFAYIVEPAKVIEASLKALDTSSVKRKIYRPLERTSIRRTTDDEPKQEGLSSRSVPDRFPRAMP